MLNQEFEELVTLVIDVYGENELECAMARAFWTVAHCPLDAKFRHLIPAARRESAVQCDSATLREAVAAELRRLVRPH
jgi:hypothetical protein